jgi:4-nitrophenyl phosphatase
MVAAIQAVVQKTPVVIGKPEPAIFLEAVEKMGLSMANCAAVGDRLEIDIACARRAGIPGILVLSGMTHRGMIEDSPFPPDLVFEDIGEMVAHWDAILGD